MELAPSKPQQVHYTQFFPALGAKIIDIFNVDINLPSVIPAIPSVIPVETGIHIRCGADIRNITLRFLKK